MRIQYDSEGFQPPRHGLILLQVLVFFLFVLFVARFWYLQVHRGEELARQSVRNHLRHELIYAARGHIYDRDGLLLAGNRPAFNLALVREDCHDIPATLAQVADWANVPFETLQAKYAKAVRHVKPFEPLVLVDDISFELLTQMEAVLLHWPGLEVLSTSKRMYPQGPLYAHILGYVAEANEKELGADDALSLGDFVGRQGLELVHEKHVRGAKGMYEMEVNVLGRKMARRLQRAPASGQDIVLSLDNDLQQAARDALGDQVGSIVVMDPDTGKVLALVTTPAYDNNAFASGISQKEWDAICASPFYPMQNRSIQSMYPPASLWKLMMTGLFLQEGIAPKEKVYCNGQMKLGNQVFRCWRKWGHGKVDMAEAIKVSCDVYYYEMANRVGIDKLAEFAKGCGFGTPTGINLPHEASGLVPSREWKKRRFKQPWYGGETLNVSIGQGYTLVTPIQMATFIASVLNGGQLLTPSLILDEPIHVRGTTPMSKLARTFVIDSMRMAVEEKNGTAAVLRRKDAIIGGKTGTAQVVRIVGDERLKKEEMAYLHRDHAWIGAWGEKNGQRYVVVCLVEHGGGGSSTAGPIAKQVFAKLFDEEEMIDDAK